jgi:hypothetical protein
MNDIFTYILVHLNPYLIVFLVLIYEFASLYIRLRILVLGWSIIWNLIFDT